MISTGRRWGSEGLTGACVALAIGCGGAPREDDGAASSGEDLSARAYVISEGSNELFVVDLATMTEVGSVDTSAGAGVNANHMSLVSRDGAKIYVTATDHDSLVVVDARSLEVSRRVPLGAHPTHAEICPGCAPGGGDQLWVVNEGGAHGGDEPVEHEAVGSVSIVDMATDEVVASFSDPSLMAPHFVRFQGGRAFIPSIAGNQITVVGVESLQLEDVLLLEGEAAPGACSGDPCGFADAQIDRGGLLVAAHIETGRVLTYDTHARARRPDLTGGDRPWSVFVDTFSDAFDTHLMPNWGDETVSVIDRREHREIARSPAGDPVSYGVNFSPLAEGEAFVLNSVGERVSVIDRVSGELIEALDVGGTTETASTTGDGRHLLLPLSSTNQLAVLDIATRSIVARFEDVGVYPWSVTTLGGQSYCH